MNPEQPDLELKRLGEFTGTENWYKTTGGILITDGVKYICDNGYAWFVDDAIAVIITHPKIREYLKKEDFLVIKLRLKDSTADMTIEDGRGRVLYKQHYEYTDAKRDLDLFYSGGVLCLPSEY